jgi:ribonuclease HI
MSSNIKKTFESFLYRNKLNQKSFIDVLDNLSNKSIENIMKDLSVLDNFKHVDDTLYVFSDGNCKGNGKKDARAGYSIFFTDNSESPYYKFNTTKMVASEPTNNKAELSGIRRICKTVNENKKLFKNKNIVVCTDSSYSIKCVTLWYKGWVKNNWVTSKKEPVKNKLLIEDIVSLMDQLKTDNNTDIQFKHVFSHTVQPKDKDSMEYFLWYGNNKVDDNINRLLRNNIIVEKLE